MATRLLAPDYDNIVMGTFALPESDFDKYYQNIVEENIKDNHDIFKELTKAIERSISWYREQHSDDYLYKTWGVDESGIKTEMNPDEIGIPLLHLNIKGNIYIHVDKSFFDRQIFSVESVELLYRGRTLLAQSDDQLAQLDQLIKEAEKKIKVEEFASILM